MNTSDACTCRIFGCGKNCAEGWRLYVEHVEAHMASKRCSHGNDEKHCIECLSEALRTQAVIMSHQVPENELLALTARLDEHPEGWEHPCMCATCRSYADG